MKHTIVRLRAPEEQYAVVEDAGSGYTKFNMTEAFITLLAEGEWLTFPYWRVLSIHTIEQGGEPAVPPTRPREFETAAEGKALT